MLIRRGLFADAKKGTVTPGLVETVLANRKPISSTTNYSFREVVTLQDGDAITIELSTSGLIAGAAYAKFFTLLGSDMSEVFGVSYTNRKLSTMLCGQTDINKTYNSGVSSGTLKFVLYWAGGYFQCAQAFVNDVEVYPSIVVDNKDSINVYFWKGNPSAVSKVKITHSQTV